MTFHYTPCKYRYYYPFLRLRDKNNVTRQTKYDMAVTYGSVFAEFNVVNQRISRIQFEIPCENERLFVFYFPAFSSEKIQGRIFWASQVMDIPFLGMSPDACLSTSCPIEAGEKNTYHVEVPILKKYPVVSIRGSFTNVDRNVYGLRFN